MTFYLHPYSYRRTARRQVEDNQHTLGVNVREEDEAYVLSALVPGLKSEDVNIQVLDDVLRIEGEYKQDETRVPSAGTSERFVHSDPAPARRHRRGLCRSKDRRWSLNAETAQGRIRPTEADQDHVQIRSERSNQA